MANAVNTDSSLALSWTHGTHIGRRSAPLGPATEPEGALDPRLNGMGYRSSFLVQNELLNL